MRLRSSACVELQPLTALEGEQRELLRELENDPDLVALLVPKPPLPINLKAVPRRTAELFQSFAAPSRLDERTLGDADSVAEVVELVLDGIFEIESGDGFVSGADALPLLGPLAAPPVPRARIARLSHDALLHAQDLESRDPRTLMWALYHYNRLPITQFWKSRFAGADAVLESLGAGRGPLRGLLENHWRAPVRMPMFVSWPSRVQVPRDQPALKLYVSPRPEHVREVFEVTVRTLAEFPRSSLKIGNDAAGMLRPDKIMAYFATRGELDEAAGMLRTQLSGCEAQGVPFTAAIDDEGLLSWGADPPEEDRALQWTARHSSRSWVTTRLGEALAVAKAARSAAAVEPWWFAVERLRRQGVDVETWMPRLDFRDER